MKLQNSFAPSSDLYQTLDAIAEISAFSPRIRQEGMLRSSEASKGVLIMGIDAEREKKISGIYEYTLREDGSRYLQENRDHAGRRESHSTSGLLPAQAARIREYSTHLV